MAGVSQMRLVVLTLVASLVMPVQALASEPDEHVERPLADVIAGLARGEVMWPMAGARGQSASPQQAAPPEEEGRVVLDGGWCRCWLRDRSRHQPE